MKKPKSEEHIINNWNSKIKNPVVSIRCITFNHESFIKDTIEGFLIQETDYPYEILIHDDCSTDNTASIIKHFVAEYPQIIKPYYQPRNTYTLSAEEKIRLRKPFVNMAKGKYIAICEGDDFWTDPEKLQRQVDALEQHPECSFSFHARTMLREDGSIVHRPFIGDRIITDKQIVSTATKHAHTCTLVVRRDFYEELPEWAKRAPIGDVPLKLFMMTQGSAYYIDRNMATYRANTPQSYTRRMQQDSQRFIAVKKGKEQMWESFNNYTSNRYVDQVLPHQFAARVQVLAHEPLLQRIRVLPGTYKDILLQPVCLKTKGLVILQVTLLLVKPFGWNRLKYIKYSLKNTDRFIKRHHSHG